ncbi:MAG: hypothetical protein IT480_17380 [Gammaproteobacteria bacterium]|nr:hypothetical protein [Gammaproteobacteria bacterium]
MNRQRKAWLAATLAAIVTSGSLAAAPLEAQLSMRAGGVNGGLSTDRMLFLGRCADCERLQLQLRPETQYFVNGQASNWRELRGFLRANPEATLQVSYQVRTKNATRLAVTSQSAQ